MFRKWTKANRLRDQLFTQTASSIVFSHFSLFLFRYFMFIAFKRYSISILFEIHIAFIVTLSFFIDGQRYFIFVSLLLWLQRTHTHTHLIEFVSKYYRNNALSIWDASLFLILYYALSYRTKILTHNANANEHENENWMKIEIRKSDSNSNKSSIEPNATWNK